MVSTPARRRVATAAILLSLMIAAFEGTAVTGAMPVIARELGGLEAYSWVFSAFLVASTLGVLACGKLADAFGRRLVYAGGMGLFLAASAACGASRSIEQLVAFRVLQGLGAGAIQPLAMTISADLYTTRERATVQGLFTSVWGASNVAGPVLGGFLVVELSWRWVFYVNIPLGLLAVPLLFASYTDPPRAKGGLAAALGAVLAGLTAGLLLLSLEPEQGWGRRLALLAGAAALGGVLVLREQRSASPLLAPALRKSRVVRAALVAGIFAGALLYASTAYVPLLVSHDFGASALGSGASLIPLLVGWSVGSTFGVRILVRWGMRASVAGGFALALVGAIGVAAAVSAGLALPWMLGALGVMGLGLGPAASTALIGSQSQARPEERGMITSAVFATRMLGGSLMIAALGAMRGVDGPAARFAAIAGLTVVAVIAMAAYAPRELPEGPAAR